MRAMLRAARPRRRHLRGPFGRIVRAFAAGPIGDARFGSLLRSAARLHFRPRIDHGARVRTRLGDFLFHRRARALGLGALLRSLIEVALNRAGAPASVAPTLGSTNRDMIR